MSTRATTPRRRARDTRTVFAYLSALVGRDPDGLLEVRARRPGGMSQRFYSAGELRRAADEVLALGEQTDVYVGCLPRRRRAGGRDSLRPGLVLWADCDDQAAVDALAGFRPRPAMIVRSGTEDRAHAYWTLRHAAEPDAIAAANRRIAHALGADLKSAEAARILRPPDTLNFKHAPARPVTLQHLNLTRRHDLDDVVDGLVDPPMATATATPAPATQRPGPGRTGDPLLAIAPAVYVEALTGLAAARDGKVSCPFHQDRSPSLHVYAEPERGWHCFGCGRGGSIYDLAAELEHIPPRGRDFVALRHQLEERFNISRPRPPR